MTSQSHQIDLICTEVLKINILKQLKKQIKHVHGADKKVMKQLNLASTKFVFMESQAE